MGDIGDRIERSNPRRTLAMSVSGNPVLAGAVVVEGGGVFPHAVRRLKESFPDVDWRVGRADGKTPAIALADDAGLVEGAFRLVTEARPAPVIRISGGRVSGVIYGIEELIKRGDATPDRL